MNKNKRGQSEIITTVLIILLVLAAIVIVWQVVKGTVSTGSEQVTSAAGCIGISLDITTTTKTIIAPIVVDSVTIKRGADSIPTATSATSPGLNSIKVIVEDSTGAQKCSQDLLYSVPLPITLQELKLNTGCVTALVAGNYKVKIAPKINGQQCDVADTEPVTI